MATGVAVITAAAVFLLMVGEAVLSRVNEAALRRQGAIEPAGDVYRRCSGRIRACFWRWRSRVPGVVRLRRPWVLVAGLALFGVAKALKLWAIASLRRAVVVPRAGAARPPAGDRRAVSLDAAPELPGGRSARSSAWR